MHAEADTRAHAHAHIHAYADTKMDTSELMPLLRLAGDCMSVCVRISGVEVTSTGKLTPDGFLVDAEDGSKFDAPTGWAVHCIKRSKVNGKCNGWQKVFYNGTSLDDMRKSRG